MDTHTLVLPNANRMAAGQHWHRRQNPRRTETSHRRIAISHRLLPILVLQALMRTPHVTRGEKRV